MGGQLHATLPSKYTNRQTVGIENTEESRRAYRELLFTSPQDIPQSISAVILFHETLYQKTKQGVPFVEILKQRNIIPGA